MHENATKRPWTARGLALDADGERSLVICSPTKKSGQAFDNAKLIESAVNGLDDIALFASNFEIAKKEDGVWFILHGKGTTGAAAFKLADCPDSSLLAIKVALYLEEDRKAILNRIRGER